jgi:hypothetical protein
MSVKRKCHSVAVQVVVALAMAASITYAQEITYLGTVLAVEASRVQVKTVDEATRQEQTHWFLIDRDTRVKRGDQVVAQADAKITPGERIAVIVDPAGRTRLQAKEIRLAATPEAGRAPAPPARPAAPPAADPHAGHQMPGQAQTPAMAMSSGWQLIQDGVVYGLFNHQGGPRGGDELVAPNWWMGMLMREQGRHQFSLNAMLSLDAATVGKSGYREIFQVGEALEGKPLIDRQHPHDLFMQIAASWRMTLGDNTSLVLAGGPAGEPTLGPVAFMHRTSAAGLILAPLGHHTFDSTHISFGVVTAALERGRWTFEGSIFNGREPDEHRWDFDFGAMDSVAGRVWFRPTDDWEAQVSTGLLREPEELVPGNARRTTASLSWFRRQNGGFKAATVGYGVNTAHGERRHGVFGELTMERGATSIFGRLEIQHVETRVLLTGEIPDEDHTGDEPSAVTAFSAGAARRMFTARGFEGALGAQVTFYGVPDPLRLTHGQRPVSFLAFFRLRLPSGDSGRMWNMRMSQGHKMTMDHSGHVMR